MIIGVFGFSLMNTSLEIMGPVSEPTTKQDRRGPSQRSSNNPVNESKGHVNDAQSNQSDV